MTPVGSHIISQNTAGTVLQQWVGGWHWAPAHDETPALGTVCAGGLMPAGLHTGKTPGYRVF